MGMEDETRAFLVTILQTISIVLLWMMVNVFIGIYKGYAFLMTALPGKITCTMHSFLAASSPSSFTSGASGNYDQLL